MSPSELITLSASTLLILLLIAFIIGLVAGVRLGRPSIHH
jgi:hypothetical protein